MMKHFGRRLSVLIFFLGIFPSCAEVKAGGIAKETIAHKISPEEYWTKFAVGLLSDIKEDENGVVYGRFPHIDHDDYFSIKKEKLLEPGVRTRVYISVIKTFGKLAFEERRQSNQSEKKQSQKRLKELTGIDFRSEDAWKQWIQKNESYLQYSNELDRLVIVNEE